MDDREIDDLVRDLVPRIANEVGVKISQVSSAMIGKYSHDDWLYEYRQYTVRLTRYGTSFEEEIETTEGSAFKSPNQIETELRSAFNRLLSSEAI